MRKNVSKRVLKMKRKDRLKHRRRKFFISCSIILGLLIVSSLTIYSIKLKKELKNLSFAINYHFTNSALEDDRLMEVDDYKLLFSDDETAIIEAYGLTYNEPHTNTVVQRTFKRNKSGNWEL